MDVSNINVWTSSKHFITALTQRNMSSCSFITLLETFVRRHMEKLEIISNFRKCFTQELKLYEKVDLRTQHFLGYDLERHSRLQNYSRCMSRTQNPKNDVLSAKKYRKENSRLCSRCQLKYQKPTNIAVSTMKSFLTVPE